MASFFRHRAQLQDNRFEPVRVLYWLLVAAVTVALPFCEESGINMVLFMKGTNKTNHATFISHKLPNKIVPALFGNWFYSPLPFPQILYSLKKHLIDKEINLMHLLHKFYMPPSLFLIKMKRYSSKAESKAVTYTGLIYTQTWYTYRPYIYTGPVYVPKNRPCPEWPFLLLRLMEQIIIIRNKIITRGTPTEHPVVCIQPHLLS